MVIKIKVEGLDKLEKEIERDIKKAQTLKCPLCGQYLIKAGKAQNVSCNRADCPYRGK